MNRSTALLLWTLLVGASFLGAPPTRPDASAWAAQLLLGQWEGENPLTVAHFNLMGLWPLLFAALLAPDLRARPLPAWPFVAGSMALGAFVLLPWFALVGRDDAPGEAGGWAGTLGAVVALGAGVMGAWGLWAGDFGGWQEARATEGFMYIMTLDFGVLWIASLLECKAQSERMGSQSWRMAVFPLVGAAAWVAWRRWGTRPTA